MTRAACPFKGNPSSDLPRYSSSCAASSQPPAANSLRRDCMRNLSPPENTEFQREKLQNFKRFPPWCSSVYSVSSVVGFLLPIADSAETEQLHSVLRTEQI